MKRRFNPNEYLRCLPEAGGPVTVWAEKWDAAESRILELKAQIYAIQKDQKTYEQSGAAAAIAQWTSSEIMGAKREAAAEARKVGRK